MIGNYVAALAFLIPCSIWDIRTRQIPVLWLVAGGLVSLCAAGWSAMTGESGIVSMVFAMSPGMFLLALSIVTEQQIGVGDGISAAILGLFLGAPMIYMVLMGALFLSSICAAVLLISHRGARHSRMPWIPFMAAGVIVSILLEGGVI